MSTPLATSPPVAELWVTPESGFAPLAVTLDASFSYDMDGAVVDFVWDLDGDGTFNEAGAETDARNLPAADQSYAAPGDNTPQVRVTDDGGLTDTSQALISVNAPNQPPEAVLDVTPTTGAMPLLVQFDASGSSDPEAGVLDFSWDLDGDGSFSESGPEFLATTRTAHSTNTARRANTSEACG